MAGKSARRRVQTGVPHFVAVQHLAPFSKKGTQQSVFTLGAGFGGVPAAKYTDDAHGLSGVADQGIPICRLPVRELIAQASPIWKTDSSKQLKMRALFQIIGKSVSLFQGLQHNDSGGGKPV
ncbi:MAG: hypothetical protein KGR48_11725 [Alphaproteobacteria bacterium]|nr:hypothetical protein [Alphaproteobacteria bacterium]MBU6473872.1 hypothetical protein [Alphaproteobacteria bacterium]MDE2013434.1 hypothetical protein [Alphaproteobacteria bacterium]MDE2073285.1 hypothetical protein [Alphaproteobacteria bacterium]MDE2351207.1 hypothetical protein [Alphaproteobacteria bacterium]